MHQPKESLPVTMEGDGLSVRLIGWGETAVSFMQMPAGMDLTPALAGLPDSLCSARTGATFSKEPYTSATPPATRRPSRPVMSSTGPPVTPYGSTRIRSSSS